MPTQRFASLNNNPPPPWNNHSSTALKWSKWEWKHKLWCENSFSDAFGSCPNLLQPLDGKLISSGSETDHWKLLVLHWFNMRLVLYMVPAADKGTAGLIRVLLLWRHPCHPTFHFFPAQWQGLGASSGAMQQFIFAAAWWPRIKDVQDIRMVYQRLQWLSSVSVHDTGYFLVSLSFLADAERHGPVERHALTSLFPDH